LLASNDLEEVSLLKLFKMQQEHSTLKTSSVIPDNLPVSKPGNNYLLEIDFIILNSSL
jgi:hypothetical protein